MNLEFKASLNYVDTALLFVEVRGVFVVVRGAREADWCSSKLSTPLCLQCSAKIFPILPVLPQLLVTRPRRLALCSLLSPAPSPSPPKTQIYVTESLSASKMMTIDSFGPEQSASARRGKKSRTNNAAPSYAAQEPMLPQVRAAPQQHSTIFRGHGAHVSARRRRGSARTDCRACALRKGVCSKASHLREAGPAGLPRVAEG